mgnify:CR=1 FL=1
MYSTTENVIETSLQHNISLRDACYKISLDRIQNVYLENNLQENTELKNYETRINKYLGQHLTYQIAYTMIKCCQILNIIGCKDLNQFTNKIM